jgi:TPR repeat protein
VPQDFKLAAEWYEKAAKQNDQFAMQALGQLYTYGAGVPKDTEIAYRWLELAVQNPAADQGIKDLAIFQRDKLAKEMSAEQVESARAEAARWQWN